MPVTRAIHALPFCLASLVAAGAPPNKQVLECVKASEAAQTARDELRYEDARAALARCTAASCPEVVQTDCAKWLAQLEIDQPNLVLVTTLEGADVTEGFAVAIDGRRLTSFLPGQPLRIDPGTRQVTVTLPDGRSLSEKLVVNAGERNRRVTFAFAKVKLAPETVPSAPLTGLPTVEKTRSAPIAPILLTTVTAAGVATFSVLGFLGNGQLAPVLADPCASTRSCDPALVEPARGLYVGADLALGAAVVFAVLATWQWIVWAGSSR